MRPQLNLPTKDQLSQQALQEKTKKLEELNEKIKELERFKEFSEINELLNERKTIENVENINFIDVYINKINNLIRSLSQPVQTKIEQLNFLKALIEKYCDQSEIQGLNSSLAIHENKLKDEIAKDPIDSQEIAKHLVKIDSILYKNLKKILGKIRQTLSEKSWDAKYGNYLASQLDLINLSEKEITEKSTEILACFETIKFVIESITEFETNHNNFTNLEKNFNLAEEYFNKLTNDLLNSEAINSFRSEIEGQIKILNREFAEFYPRSKSLDHLNLGFFELSQKLNELHQLNQNELQNQQDIFIRLIEDSKQDLTDYAKKLSLLKSKCAYNKSEQLQIIIQKIDLLLNPEINMEENVSKREITPEKILDLKETLKDANSVLSGYRGISLLRCFATLWGGGRVTSQLLVDKLETQLTDLQTNMSRLSTHS